jgi:hypothetical protein
MPRVLLQQVADCFASAIRCRRVQQRGGPAQAHDQGAALRPVQVSKRNRGAHTPGEGRRLTPRTVGALRFFVGRSCIQEVWP